ncbi:MAG: flagellin [Planctomycetota bacterium]|nr:flagellin [Planctomycetota bacterium]
MAVIPANLGRVPDLLSRQVLLGNIARSNVGLVTVQQQISTGRAISRYSDAPVRASVVSHLDDRLDRAQQVSRNIEHARGSLDTLDNALGEATDLAQQARDIASSQLSFGTSPEERAGQAVVVDQLLASLMNISNRKGPAGSLLGGSTPSRQPVVDFLGGYRYQAEGAGFTIDGELVANIPLTLGDGNAIAGVSGRVRGTVDLDPTLTRSTLVSNLRGARGVGVTPGTVELSIRGGERIAIDLSQARGVNDVLDAINGAVREFETTTGETILGPAGVGLNGGAISIDVAPAPPGGDPPTLQFFDVASSTTGLDLGLVEATPFTFSSTRADGVAIDPELTLESPISSLAALAEPLGSIRLRAMGRSVVVDLSGARTIQDVKNLIEGAGLGARVVVNEAKTGIDVVSEVSTGRDGALAIEEVAGNNLTATRLGIRSLSPETRIADFNDGLGVRIVDDAGSREQSIDFTIVLGNGAGTRIDVDLRPQDIATVDTLIGRINAEAQAQLAQAGLPTTALVAGLSDAGNGIVLRQDTSFTGQVRVIPQNNSGAAEQLGLQDGRFDAGTNSLIGEDRAKARPLGLFSRLIDLRDGLRDNDTFGIGLAAEGLRESINLVAQERALVGGYGRRVESAEVLQQDRITLDESLRSQLRDTDFASAAVKLSQLQTQLEAGYRVAATANSLSLLDFLG